MERPWTHVAVMLGNRDAATTWKHDVEASLRGWGIMLDETLDEDGSRPGSLGLALYAHVWLLGMADDGGPPSIPFTTPCPYLQGLVPIGHDAWREHTWAGDVTSLRSDWLRPFIKEGFGAIHSLVTGHHRAAVHEQSFSLGNLHKYGFDDGDVLLTRDEHVLNNYRGDTWNRIERALDAAGVDVDLGGPLYTCHNPYRVYTPGRVDGIEYADERDLLGALWPHEVNIWCFDFDAANDTRLFAET